MKRIFRLETKRNENGVLQFFSLFLFSLPIYGAQNTLECSEMIQNNKCTCYIFENGKSRCFFFVFGGKLTLKYKYLLFFSCIS